MILSSSSTSISRHLTHLVGTNVVVTLAAAEPTGPHVYAVYKTYPSDTALVVKADLRLLGSLAGSLVGLPDSEIATHFRSASINESVRDAMYEVLNVASAVIVEQGRAVLMRMTTDQQEIQDLAIRTILSRPNHAVYYQLTVQGYEGGRLAILS